MNVLTGWPQLSQETAKNYFQNLQQFLKKEYAEQIVFPPEKEIFQALELTSLNQVKVVILGQDPYHEEGQANGLSFSVTGEAKIPPSLRNIYQELQNDLGISPAKSGDLTPWAKQGVLLLNAVLTVRAHQANSHSKRGWEQFTDAIILELSARKQPIVFILWGASAQKKAAMIAPQHMILKSPHPSPLSAYRGFFGSRPFSKANAALIQLGQTPIDWRLEK
ncbi:uracil-DNA glycosylase [Enterococcus timonensis]|uniref:uracil-DNA glycosylase n=1 Tax=Enterococcus timonensis TaxID=1852364 RepID=UPI0008D954A8|nr:uracil-DNA glycosylase [Enterococcus timonensis]